MAQIDDSDPSGSPHQQQGSPRQCALAVVDPSRLFREGLLGILQPSQFRVVSASPTIDGAFAQLRGQVVDMVLFSHDQHQDLHTLLASIRLLREQGMLAKVVLLLPFCTTPDLIAAVVSGVDGVVLKDISGERLISALDLVMHGQDVLPLGTMAEIFARLPGMTRPAVPPVTEAARLVAVPATLTTLPPIPAPVSLPAMDGASRSASLSDRERQILQCLVEGYANKLIARRLNIAEATVKVHIKGLLRKINVSNRTQAAIWALNQNVTVQSRDEVGRDEVGPRPPRSLSGVDLLVAAAQDVPAECLHHA